MYYRFVPETQRLLKIRLWRLFLRKTLRDVATEVRLPAYIVSAIERGELQPSERWVRRFREAYGPELAAQLLAPADPASALNIPGLSE